jgi:FlaA1/EpsC-like NDP-sugar epimerase
MSLKRVVLRNRFVVVIDIVCWAAIPLLLLALRFEDVSLVGRYLPAVGYFLAIAIPVKFVSLWSRGLYQRYWRYASIDELIDVVLAVSIAGVINIALYFLVVVPLTGNIPRLPRSTPVVDIFVTILQVGGIRFAFRVWDRVRHRSLGMADGSPVIVAGAGNAGSMIVRELQQAPQLKLEPVAFVDDDPGKRSAYIHGLRVEGGLKDLARVARLYNATHVIIAMPSATGAVIREIRDACVAAHLQAKTIPGMYDILAGKVTVGALRNVEIEDLLRRDPVVTDQAAVAELVRGMTVLVTGAGGSIGSELCRQIARLGACRMILLGHGENSIFDVHNELQARFPAVEYEPVIADIRDEARIGGIFDRFRPQAVFHAAAHKHVPLMEMNPEEAVTNNVGGTLNLLRHAERVGASHFVFISTDKAVNPANVMGATKLLAEQLVHEFGQRTRKAYVSVRFGNVLGSRGSVVPFFQRQIARGGPVTVTHEEIRRYFMTIPEAVQLVLQAAALGGGGETFVLDMGEPVRIADLATDLIRLSGLEVGRDIEIVFTGLRPGEKMFEELFLDGEEYERTAHQKIFRSRNGKPHVHSTDVSLRDLLLAAEGGDAERAQRLLAAIAPTSARGQARPRPAFSSSEPQVTPVTPLVQVVGSGRARAGRATSA